MLVGILFLIIAVFVIGVIWWIATSNGIKVSGLKVKEAESGIDVALTKRYDVLTKMVDIVKGYKEYEANTMIELVKLRSGMSMREMSNANKNMDDVRRSINVIAENYPQLRSSENFVELERAVVDVEEHLQAARRLYNANVTHYNTKIITFPSSIVAGSMGAVEKEFFEAEDMKKSDVKMNF